MIWIAHILAVMFFWPLLLITIPIHLLLGVQSFARNISGIATIIRQHAEAKQQQRDDQALRKQQLEQMRQDWRDKA